MVLTPKGIYRTNGHNKNLELCHGIDTKLAIMLWNFKSKFIIDFDFEKPKFKNLLHHQNHQDLILLTFMLTLLNQTPPNVEEAWMLSQLS